MNEETTKTPIHLWIVGVVALLWNAMGAFDYTATQLQLESYMSQFTQEQLDFFYGIPAWAVAFWAIAVWGSLLGSLALLLRKAWARWLFLASLVGLIVTTIQNFLLSNGAEAMGQAGVIFSVIIWVIAIGLLWYSHSMSQRGVLR